MCKPVRVEEEEEEEEEEFGRFGAFWFGTFVMLFHSTGGHVGHENTWRWTVCWYKHLSVYCVWDLERVFCIIIYCMSALSLHTLESTNSDYCCRDSEQVLTCYLNCSRCSSGIPHSAAVCAKDVSYTLVNGEHSLIGSCHRISHHLCLLVCCIESYHSPILPPSDSGSRSTSGGTGEGSGSLTIHQYSSCGCSWNKRSMEWTLFQW